MPKNTKPRPSLALRSHQKIGPGQAEAWDARPDASTSSRSSPTRAFNCSSLRAKRSAAFAASRSAAQAAISAARSHRTRYSGRPRGPTPARAGLR